MKKNLERITRGAIAGLVAGLVGSWAANQFHSLWSHLDGGEQNPEVARLSDRGGRPDTAAAKEKVASGEPPEEDATVAIASKVSHAVFEHSLTNKEKHRAGVAVHYSFGAMSGAFYGAVSEVAPLARILSGAGLWDRYLVGSSGNGASGSETHPTSMALPTSNARLQSHFSSCIRNSDGTIEKGVAIGSMNT